MTQDLENTLYFDLPAGRVTIRLRPDLAPNHVARIKELVRQGFYDGTPFHRVMDGFMAQGGDPKGTGTGGSGQKLKGEFSKEPFQRGTCGMARTQDPNSADSQFFICLADCDFLTGSYTVWGEVVDGMDAVDALKKAPAGRQSGAVDNPDHLQKAHVAADA
jgi:peptidylprolyl isomerase